MKYIVKDYSDCENIITIIDLIPVLNGFSEVGGRMLAEI
jgi:hypothetical protein